jgi:hypothetical protein
MIATEDLGRCTMPGCLSPAFWVHGVPLTDGSGRDAFPWRLCNCCQESVLAADQLLKGDVAVAAGLCEPDDSEWLWEACKTAVSQARKEER